MTQATTSMARHTLAYAMGSVVGGITRAVLLPIVARRLSSEEYGIYSLVLSATNLLHLLFEMGLVTALIKFHAESPDESSRRRLRSLLFLGMPAIDLLIALPVVLFRDSLSHFIFGSPDQGKYVAIAVAIAFFAAQFQLYLGHIRADNRSRDYAILMGVRGVLSLSTTFLFVFALDWGLPGFLLGNLAGPFLVSAAMAPRMLFAQGIDFTGWRAKLRGILVFGAPLVPSSLGFWALSNLDVYLLRVMSGLGTVGTYNFASELCLPIALLMGAITLAWPSFAFAKAREEGGPAEIARVFRHLFVALVGGSLAVALFRRELLMLLGSATFNDSLPLIPWLALSTCLYGASLAFATGLQVTGATRKLPLLIIAAIVVNGLLNLLLIPRFSGQGSAFATCLTNALLAWAVLVVSNAEFPIPFERRRLALVIAGAGLVLLAGELAVPLGALAAFALRVPLLFGFPVVLMLVGAISRSEMTALPRVLVEMVRSLSPRGRAA